MPCARASPSPASITARSRPRSSACRARTCGSPLPSARARTAKCATCLSHLGLTVTRLIRVSFGPFQLGELEAGAVEEVPTRTLREQLGDKLISTLRSGFFRAGRADAGADTSAEAGGRTPERRGRSWTSRARPRDRNRKRKTAKRGNRPIMPGARTRKSARPRNCTANFAAPAAKTGLASAGRRDARGTRQRPQRPPGRGRALRSSRRSRDSAARKQPAKPVRRGRRRASGSRLRRAAAAAAGPLMRVVGGRLRGRALAGPKSYAIRPTADRLRESLFNILIHAYGDPISGARVLDLFAGTGALGIEAISRGAQFRAVRRRRRRGARADPRERRRARTRRRHAGFSAATRPSSARRIRSSRFRSPSSIRPTAKISPRRRSIPRAPAAGSRPMR